MRPAIDPRTLPSPRAAAAPLLAPLVLLAALAVLSGCQTAPPAARASTLPPAVLLALQKAGVPASAMAAVAIPLFAPLTAPGASMQPAAVWAYQADMPMQPGSTMKLVTSIVALDRLGPNLRGTTQLRSAAPLQGGVLQGDLVLRGGADPDLDVPQFWALLLDLRQRGVTTITGDLLIDRTLFRPARTDLGMPPFDDEPEFPYNVIPDALQLAGNLLTFDMHGTAGGVVATTVPPLPGLGFVSRMQLVDVPCDSWNEHWQPAGVDHSADGSTVITLNGAFPRDCTQRVELQLIDRLELAERLFRTLWAQLGGQWLGRAREAAGPSDTPAETAVDTAANNGPNTAPTTTLLAQHTSRTWGEVLRPMNKQSDNPWTRMLFLQLGVPEMAQQPERSTAELAAQAVRGWLVRHGIDDAGLVLDNGSGLSRSERITPRQLATMLQVAHAGPNAPDLLMSMPTVGVDGTMRNRLKASPAAGWARLKSGTLRNVVAVAGYVLDGSGRPWAVAAMINHDDVRLARPVLDAWIDGIARSSPFGPAAAAATATAATPGTPGAARSSTP